MIRTTRGSGLLVSRTKGPLYKYSLLKLQNKYYLSITTQGISCCSCKLSHKPRTITLCAKCRILLILKKTVLGRQFKNVQFSEGWFGQYSFRQVQTVLSCTAGAIKTFSFLSTPEDCSWDQLSFIYNVFQGAAVECRSLPLSPSTADVRPECSYDCTSCLCLHYTLGEDHLPFYLLPQLITKC